MSGFVNAIQDLYEFRTLSDSADKHRLPMGVLGLSHVHKAHFISAFCDEKQQSALVIVPDEGSASRLTGDLEALGTPAILYPAVDITFRPDESHSREYEQQRLGVLAKMCAESVTVVCSAEAAMQLVPPPSVLAAKTKKFEVGDDFPVQELTAFLVSCGYTHSDVVEGKGQFAVRGGIVDVFVPSYAQPLRLEFWGDSIDSLAFFDPETQRRGEPLMKAEITPASSILCDSEESLAGIIENFAAGIRGKGSVKARESLLQDVQKLRGGVRLLSPDRYFPLLYGDGATIFDYAAGCQLFVVESAGVKARALAAQKLLLEDIKALFEDGILTKGLEKYALSFDEMCDCYAKKQAVFLDNLARGSFDIPVKELVTVSARQLNPWSGQLLDLLEDVRPCIKRGNKTVVLAGTEKAAQSLCEELNDEGVDALYFPVPPAEFPSSLVAVMPGALSAGMEYPNAKFTLITYGVRQASLRAAVRKKPKAANAFTSLDELHRGDYVVHSVHGIGVFEGINSLHAAGTTKDYIKIKYARDDVLYVPVTQLDLVSRYIGPSSDTKQLKLNRLGSDDWQKTRSRVRAAVKDMAAELIALYSKRLNIKGFAFSPDIDMQSDFERRFEFDETPDQLRCIDEIKQDMEKPCPMDRLLCGDVGFGKTEVALRAAFKCAADGKQCAILVPTTILALQHYQTLKKRFDTFPIESDMLSRFRSPAEQQEIIKKLKRGSLDIVVGTHRLISNDIVFKNLGLVVIDEEQRFGVAQKEKLKELFPAVDVLTLSATPIPRTLNMAMSGVRDMSIIEEAPLDRHPVQTYVIEHDDEIIAEAIERELRRGGQVYYLHNRVEDIQRTAARLHEMLPDARIGIGHGKMNEDELGDVWQNLLEGSIDVLVCTTIIETGVDVPNVNTLIIEHADRMGLSQLHQIRGRVGRSARRANAYFTFTRGQELSDIATRRLNAIREFTEFGSGFKIAMRDLELRGAGNILGAEQHGHMEAVGYDMYIKLLGEAVSEEKGETPAEPAKECLVDLHIDAHIPDKYIQSVPQKLSMYRRIADIRTPDDADDVIDELLDRYGEPPESVKGLVSVSLLRNAAASVGIYEVGQKGNSVVMYLNEIKMESVSALALAMRGRVVISATAKPSITIKVKVSETPLEVLKNAVSIMMKA